MNLEHIRPAGKMVWLKSLDTMVYVLREPLIIITISPHYTSTLQSIFPVLWYTVFCSSKNSSYMSLGAARLSFSITE